MAVAGGFPCPPSPKESAGRGVARTQRGGPRPRHGGGAGPRVGRGGGGGGAPARGAAPVGLGGERGAPPPPPRRLPPRVDPAAFSADIYPASRHGRAGLQ